MDAYVEKLWKHQKDIPEKIFEELMVEFAVARGFSQLDTKVLQVKTYIHALPDACCEDVLYFIKTLTHKPHEIAYIVCSADLGHYNQEKDTLTRHNFYDSADESES